MGRQIGLNDDVAETEVRLISLAPVAPVSKSGKPVDPIPDKDILQWGISPEEIIQRQKADKFCQNIRDRINKDRIPYSTPILSGRRVTYALC